MAACKDTIVKQLQKTEVLDFSQHSSVHRWLNPSQCLSNLNRSKNQPLAYTRHRWIKHKNFWKPFRSFPCWWLHFSYDKSAKQVKLKFTVKTERLGWRRQLSWLHNLIVQPKLSKLSCLFLCLKVIWTYYGRQRGTDNQRNRTITQFLFVLGPAVLCLMSGVVRIGFQ